MSFVVEMWWGNTNELIIEDVDDNGELFVREIVTTGPHDPERRTFTCHASNWEHSLSIGREFGWEPRGALLLPFRQSGAPAVRDWTYEPDGWMVGIHKVEAADAAAWAEALLRCVREIEAGRYTLPSVRAPILISSRMSLDRYRQANRGLTPRFMTSFAEFMAKGAFKLGWDS